MALRPRLAVLLCVLAAAALRAQDAADPPFYLGADLSYVNEMEACGAVYRTADGQARDPFTLFAQRGANLVRARLWHDPDWTAYSTLDDLHRTFQRARSAGMHTLLSLHYSDTWADPGQQAIPAAWRALPDTDALADAVYVYTRAVMASLHAAGLAPSLVQVGNEINSGLLKVAGDAPIDWPRTAQLVNAGVRALRDFSAESGVPVQVVLHVAQPEHAAWWFSAASGAGIRDYDVIGLSYYPQWSDVPVDAIGVEVAALRTRFGRPVLIVETGYPWTAAAADSAHNVLGAGLDAYPLSLWGQRRFLLDLTQQVRAGGGLGVLYWEPAWVSTDCHTRWGQGSHWENAAFFDFRRDNLLLPAADFLDVTRYR